MAIETGLWHRLSKSSIDLCQSFSPKRGGKTRPQTGFNFSVQKRPVLESSGASLDKRPHLEKD